MLRSASIACLVALPAWADGYDVEILPGYSDFRLPQIQVVDRPMSLVSDWITAFPESDEGRPTMTLISQIGDEGELIIEIEETGFLDDSVEAARQRFELVYNEDGSWTLTAYGYQQRCYRGDNHEWRAEACL